MASDARIPTTSPVSTWLPSLLRHLARVEPRGGQEVGAIEAQRHVVIGKAEHARHRCGSAASRWQASLRRSRYGLRRQGRALSFAHLDQGNGRGVGSVEARELDVEPVGIEADRHVEQEAGGDGGTEAGAVVKVDEAGQRVDGEAGRPFGPATATRTDPATGLVIGRNVGIEARAVLLGQLERRGRAVAGADRLVGGRRSAAAAARGKVEPSRQRKLWNRPRRSSKKASTACMSARDFTP